MEEHKNIPIYSKLLLVHERIFLIIILCLYKLFVDQKLDIEWPLFSIEFLLSLIPNYFHMFQIIIIFSLKQAMF